MCRVALRKVPNDPLVRDNRHGQVCRAVLGRVPNDPWVLDDPLIRDNC